MSAVDQAYPPAMEANRNAPVFAEGRIELTVPPERAWDVMADFERWPSWNPEVRSMTLDGPVAEGTEFRWKAGPATIVSTLRLVDRPNALGWSGRTMGVRALHVWRFEPVNGGSTVRMEESFEGLVATLMRERLQRQLDASTSTGLEALKAAAEKGNRSD